MSVLNECHKSLDDSGVGKCSVPMWCMGMPAGFCDREAYGEQESGQRRYGEWSMGRFYQEYCTGLACFLHGGPGIRVFKDGDSFCAVYPSFINLQESRAAFGGTPQEARALLEIPK